jgi:hypothetical protein
MGSRRRCLLAAIVTGALLSGAACVGPARGEVDYQKKAVATTEQVRSSVRTVQLAIQAAAEDDAFGSYLSRVISQAEDDANSAVSGFETIQPPSEESDQLRDDVEEDTKDALDLLTEARTAARRSDRQSLTDLADFIAQAGDDLEQFGEDNHA